MSICKPIYIYIHIYVYIYIYNFLYVVSFCHVLSFQISSVSNSFGVTDRRLEERTVEDGFGIGQFTRLEGSDGFQQAPSVEDMRNADEME